MEADIEKGGREGGVILLRPETSQPPVERQTVSQRWWPGNEVFRFYIVSQHPIFIFHISPDICHNSHSNTVLSVSLLVSLHIVFSIKVG